MKETKIYEKILRRLLAESTNKSSNLGAAIKERGKTATAILYDTNSLIELLSGRQEDGKSLEDQPDIRAATLDKVIKGYIKIYNIDDGTCYNTTLVDTIAGPGFGKELYSLGYAMSPTGLLAPARNSVSPEATAAWKKAADRGRKRHKFDDAENPKTPPSRGRLPSVLRTRQGTHRLRVRGRRHRTDARDKPKGKPRSHHQDAVSHPRREHSSVEPPQVGRLRRLLNQIRPVKTPPQPRETK
jgi:hypothetical protein